MGRKDLAEVLGPGVFESQIAAWEDGDLPIPDPIQGKLNALFDSSPDHELSYAQIGRWLLGSAGREAALQAQIQSLLREIEILQTETVSRESVIELKAKANKWDQMQALIGGKK